LRRGFVRHPLISTARNHAGVSPFA
jgi:hypothetical protein